MLNATHARVKQSVHLRQQHAVENSVEMVAAHHDTAVKRPLH